MGSSQCTWALGEGENVLYAAKVYTQWRKIKFQARKRAGCLKSLVCVFQDSLAPVLYSALDLRGHFKDLRCSGLMPEPIKPDNLRKGTGNFAKLFR